MRHLQNKRSGLTLTEVLIASAISTIVIAMIYAIFMSGNDLYEIKRYQTDLQAAGRQALNTMTAELKSATRTSSQIPSPNLIIPAQPNNTQITFYTPGDVDVDGLITDATTGLIEWVTTNPIVYQFDAGQQQLLRIEAGQQRVVANKVTDVRFLDVTMDNTLYLNELRITLTLSVTTPRRRTLTQTFSSRVRLRN